MKNVILKAIVIAAVVFTSCKNTEKNEKSTNNNANQVALTESNFGVRGNCGMCKSTIEKAAKEVNGVHSANWDVDKKNIAVSFDNSKTNITEIHKAIAASGYDTEKVVSNDEAYKNLPGCCQYDHAMEMNQSGEKKSEEHQSH